MDVKYLVIGNTAAHDGHVRKVDLDKAWRPSYENGWTDQQICGPHGHILGEYESQEDAEAALESWLDCPTAREGGYCYTHNPHGS